jgi:hypothetical protein
MRLKRLGTLGFYLLVLVLSFGIGVWVVPHADAADLGYRFFSSIVSVGDCTTDYGVYTSNAVYDYDTNTDLTAGYTSGSCSKQVNVVQGSFSGVTWHGAAIAQNASGQLCSNFNDASLTYLCNTTDKKAVSATIYFNNLRGVFAPIDRYWVTRHELGHVFGMAHMPCTYQSVMAPFEDCGIAPTSFVLRTYDIALINNWY